MDLCKVFDETRILIAPGPTSTGSYVGHLLSLPHPKSGNKTSYLFVDGSLQELHWFKQSYGSWFIGDYVSEDGRLYVATAVDPVFILLPIFEEARMKKGDGRGKFRQLDEIIYVNDFPGYQHLSSIAENTMQVLCDSKEIGSTKFFRLNDSKVLAWLYCKVHWLKQTLITLDKNYAAQNAKDTLEDVVSIIGMYLKDDPWLNLMCDKFKINIKEADKVAGYDISSAEGGLQSLNPIEEKSGSGKKPSRNAKQTKKAKVEIDSRNIKDMFSRASRRTR